MISQAPEVEEALLSTGGAARLLGSSRQHVVNMCNRGELPFTWVGRHRRIRRSAIEMQLDLSRGELTRDQEKSLWLHRALLGRLVTEPEHVLGMARENASRQLVGQRRATMTSYWLQEWLRILGGGVDEVAEVMISRSPKAVELRQNSPFAGALPQETRTQVLAAFVKHWRNEHGDRAGQRQRVGAGSASVDQEELLKA